MGDGGPVMPEWDEAVASMAMCEEATFVFSVSRRAAAAPDPPACRPRRRRPRRLPPPVPPAQVGAASRMQMPFVGARKAPPGTVVVIEVGLIDVKRENGRKREVNDYLWRQVPPTHHIPPRLPYPAASPPVTPCLLHSNSSRL